MCTQKLWRQIGGSGSLPKRDPTPFDDNARLGDWSAKSAEFAEAHLVLAINERTYLTLVFPLAPLPQFLLSFGVALGWQLDKLQIDPMKVQAEVEALLRTAEFGTNRNRSLLGSLNDLVLHCDAALESMAVRSPDSFFWVQAELNEIPHVHRDPCYGSEATRLLLERDV